MQSAVRSLGQHGVSSLWTVMIRNPRREVLTGSLVGSKNESNRNKLKVYHATDYVAVIESCGPAQHSNG